MTDKLREAAPLLPCPFCGDDGDKGMQAVTLMNAERTSFRRVSCRCCGATCPEPNWNHRAARAQQDAQAVPNYDKTELNRFAQRLYDRRIQEGRHGHYESMFHVIHKCIDRVCNPKQDLMWSTVAMQERHDDRVENIVTTLERVKQEKLAVLNATPTPPAQQDHELVQDAERWRRLVAEHSHPQPLCAVVWKKDGVRNSSEWVNMSNDNDLTRFVDALPEAVPTPPAQEKQS